MKKLLFFLLFPMVFHGQDSIVKAKHSVIALDRVNVVYRGIMNPISIAVTNAKSYTMSGEGVVLNENGTYSLRAGSGLQTTVYVDIVLADDSIIREEHVFLIKVIPILSAKLNESNCDNCTVNLNRENIKNSIISAKFESVAMDLNIIINSFDVIIIKNKNQVIHNAGNKFNIETIKELNKLKSSNNFIITNIKFDVRDFDGRVCKIKSIYCSIID